MTVLIATIEVLPANTPFLYNVAVDVVKVERACTHVEMAQNKATSIEYGVVPT